MLANSKKLFNRGLGTLLLAASLSMALLLIVVGAFALNRAGALHQKLDDVTSRDLTPLADLRMAQNTAYEATITGLVSSGTTDPDVLKRMLDKRQAEVATMQPQLTTLVEDTPEELRSYAQDLVSLWGEFSDADQAYQQGAEGPDAAALNKRASDLFDQLGDEFNAQADRLIADADAQKGEVDGAYSTLVITTIIAMALGVVLALALGLGIARNVRRRTTAMVEATDRIAAGDFTNMLAVDSKDELGKMATALNQASGTLKSMISSLAANADTLRTSSERMDGVSTQLSSSSTSTGTRADEVAEIANRVSGSVQTVAAGSEQMTASVAEISRNAADAAKVAQTAVAVAETATGVITRLGDSSTEISGVIALITSIAEQTNLLALNATIEASRAGEAGKGFAVVANEVKELAQETGKATDEIARQIQSVQTDSGKAVESITEISDVIGKISNYATSIASAVEEQTATTAEMSRHIAEAATGSVQIAEGMTDVTLALRDTNGLVDESRSASTELAGMSTDLTQMVGAFTYR